MSAFMVYCSMRCLPRPPPAADPLTLTRVPSGSLALICLRRVDTSNRVVSISVPFLKLSDMFPPPWYELARMFSTPATVFSAPSITDVTSVSITRADPLPLNDTVRLLFSWIGLYCTFSSGMHAAPTSISTIMIRIMEKAWFFISPSSCRLHSMPEAQRTRSQMYLLSYRLSEPVTADTAGHCPYHHAPGTELWPVW